ncbi:hypothetical protein VTI74DRAFT_266 [Chaetomium olivicolor]
MPKTASNVNTMNKHLVLGSGKHPFSFSTIVQHQIQTGFYLLNHIKPPTTHALIALRVLIPPLTSPCTPPLPPTKLYHHTLRSDFRTDPNPSKISTVQAPPPVHHASQSTPTSSSTPSHSPQTRPSPYPYCSAPSLFPSANPNTPRPLSARYRPPPSRPLSGHLGSRGL